MSTLVGDASALVAALVDTGEDGRWAENELTGADLAAPHLMPVEASNILRRAELSGSLGREMASMAHTDLLRLPLDLYPYEPFTDRVWELRANLTTYDAWYVALAERLSCPLLTLDRRITRAPSIRCTVLAPP